MKVLWRVCIIWKTYSVTLRPTADVAVDDTFSPNTQNAALPSTKPLRSPGLRLGLGSSTPPIKEGSASPTHGYFADGAGPTTGVGTGTAKPAGVKRTKSLMQRIKTMVRPRSGSLGSAEVHSEGDECEGLAVKIEVGQIQAT